MFGNGSFGSSTEVVELNGAEFTDSGLINIGKAVIFRKQVFAVTVLYELPASPTFATYHDKYMCWKARTGSADVSGWDSHNHRSNHTGQSIGLGWRSARRRKR